MNKDNFFGKFSETFHNFSLQLIRFARLVELRKSSNEEMETNFSPIFRQTRIENV